MFGDGSGGRLGFFSLVAWFLLLPAEECLRSSNGYLSGEERDMSQRPLSRPYLSLTAGARISRTSAATRTVSSSITIMLAVTSKSLCSRTQRHQNKQDSDYFFHLHLPCVDH